jgi:hypothetical protein
VGKFFDRGCNFGGGKMETVGQRLVVVEIGEGGRVMVAHLENVQKLEDLQEISRRHHTLHNGGACPQCRRIEVRRQQLTKR